MYVPNAGEHASGRPRLGHKLAFLRALRRRMDELTAEGRQVRNVHVLWRLRCAMSRGTLYPALQAGDAM